MGTTATIEYAGVAVAVDAEGFLVDREAWTPAIAEAIADEVGIGPLGDRHWTVIDFCRKDAAEKGEPPTLRRISRLSGVGMKELFELFPRGPGKLAARVAGLSKPKGCV